MKISASGIPDILVIEPEVFADSRGFFLESFNQQAFAKATGLQPSFVQDNYSRSSRGVLRGMHYQLRQTQGKLVSVICGEIFTVAIDVRRSSATFGKWLGLDLTDGNRKQLWIPPGFAHGFLVTSDSADVFYKTTDYYAPEFERCIAWSDPQLAIDWPLNGIIPSLSVKDQQGQSFQCAPLL